MKIISNSKVLESEFLRLQKQYNEFYWMTAWASNSKEVFEQLKKSKGKIKKIIVGLHFYQTHPDFISEFMNVDEVRYIKQPNGTFHPKVFLFYNSDLEWEVIIGSSNFTNAAFSVNTEVSTLITSKDNDGIIVLKDLINILDDVWKDSNRFSDSELEQYVKVWKNYKSKIRSLSGEYSGFGSGKRKKRKLIFHVPAAMMNWDEFMEGVYNEKYHALESRIGVLKIAKGLFRNTNSFSELGLEERKFIAGIPNKLEVADYIDWGYFGSMQGAGKFMNKIISNDINISNAIDSIPLEGQITKAHFDEFVKQYKKAFNGNFLATGTRLLAMKRPDIFVCLDSKNKSALCQGFGIVQAGLEFNRYWEDIVLSIFDAEWWLNPTPKNETEKFVSEARAAFLDSLYYTH